MEEINKEWPTEILVPVEQIEIFDPDLIESHLVTREEYDGPSSAKKKKKKEEVQEIKNALKETVPDSPRGGGDDEVNQEEEGEEDKQDKDEVTPLKDPLTEAETSEKMKVSLKKPSTQKKSRSNKPQS
jgi:hypothetical protein